MYFLVLSLLIFLNIYNQIICFNSNFYFSKAKMKCFERFTKRKEKNKSSTSINVRP